MPYTSQSFKRLWNHSVGFYAVWIAHLGRRMGLFEEIARKTVSAADLAARTKFYLPAVQAWCSAAASLGFVEEEKGGSLHLARGMKAMLVDRDNPSYLGGQFSYLALRSLEYGGLDELFRSGKVPEMTRNTLEAFEQATEWDHNAFLTAIKKSKLHTMLSRGCRLLDVGCGTGGFLDKVSKQYPRSSFVGIEPSEEAVRRANEMAGGNIAIMRQAAETMEFANEFDIAYLGESLYLADDRQRVVSNCYRALKKGGTIAIVEGLVPEKPNDESRLVMAMQLDFALQGQRFMSRSEITGLLGKAGFLKAHFTDLGGSVFLATAIK